MAAIDFPATPTNGQLFTAGNGVTYRWVTPPGIWTVSSAGNAIISTTPPANPFPGQFWFWSDGTPGGGQLFVYYDDGSTQQWVPSTPILGPPASSPGGDFFATRTSMSFVTTTAAVCLFDVIVNGNAGSWYNPANGRWTPPAGRYSVFASAGWNSTSAIIGCEVVIRKNGVQAIYAYTASGVNEFSESVAKGNLDANGTDFFDVTLRSSGTTPSQAFMPASFMAFPLGGIKGPPGDYPSGAMFLYSEQVLAAPANQMAVSFPPAAKLVELVWDAIVTPQSDPTLAFQGMRAGVPDTTANYSQGRMVSNAATAGASTVGGDQAFNATSFAPSGGFSFRGRATLTMPTKGYGVAQYMGIATSGNRQNGTAIWETALAGLDGYRLTCSINNFAIGSYLRCLVVM